MRRSESPLWRRFEEEVRLLVEAFGYAAETTQPSRDYGVDVLALSHRRKVVVQCKLYGKGRVGGETIIQLVGSREFHGASDAICITTSRYTKQAREVAASQNIALVDRALPVALCKERNLTIPSLTTLDAPDCRALHVDRPVMRIGRDQGNHLVIKSAQASRHHAVLERDGLSLTLRDLGSTNGTFVNSKRLACSAVLNYDDEVTIGGVTLAVRMDGPG